MTKRNESKCPKTVSGEHMWVTGSMYGLTMRINNYKSHGNENEQQVHYSTQFIKCFACGMIDDTHFDDEVHFHSATKKTAK